MLIGVPKEIKNHEYRVGLTPTGVRELVENGHEVIVETQAGSGISVSDQNYIAAGAKIIDNAADIFAQAEMIIKVKEPQPIECKMLREGQLLFTYLHLAPDPKQTELLVKSKCTAIAYETVTDERGGLPLLTPMSEVAGRMAIQAGANSLQRANGGRGVLLGGVPGVEPADVVVIGGGIVGLNAARMAMGLGAKVTVLERSLERMRELDNMFGPLLRTVYSTKDSLDTYVFNADLVIGAVLIPGAAAPKLITKEMLTKTTYVVDDVVHYCVANMPGAVARTSTYALTNATMPYVIALANKGWQQACRDDKHLLEGLNVHAGQVTYEAVARDLGYDYVPAASVI